MATKKSVKALPVKAQVPVAIPAAIREAKPAVAKPAAKGGIRGLFNKLADMGKKKGAESKVKTSDRPVLHLTPEVEQQFRRVAPAKVLFDRLESYVDTETGVLKDMLRQAYFQVFWASKTKPQNPALVAKGEDGKPDCTGIFMLVGKWRVEELTCKRNESPEDAFVRTLVEVVGLDEGKAEDLVHTELDFVPSISIPITALEGGDDEIAKTASQKLALYLVGESESLELDDEERASLIVVQAKVKVLDGFLDRLCTYCDDPNQLETILTTLIKPEWHCKSFKFGVSDADQVRLDRLLGEMENIMLAPEDND